MVAACWGVVGRGMVAGGSVAGRGAWWVGGGAGVVGWRLWSRRMRRQGLLFSLINVFLPCSIAPGPGS